MLEALTRNWWILVLRGVVAVVFAILLFVSPTSTLATIITLFGAFALVDGAFNAIGSLFTVGAYQGWWVSLLTGVAGIVAGLVVMTWRGLTALAVLWLIALWGIATGVLQVVAALRLRRYISGEWFMAAGGALSIVLGVLLLTWPNAAIVSLLWLVAAFALLFGFVLIALGLRVRSAHRTIRDIKSDLLHPDN